VVVVDGGEALLKNALLPPIEPELNKADAILRASGLMGMDAMAVGVAEIAVGVRRLTRVAEQNSLTLLSANIVGHGGRRLFEPRKLVAADGLKVGLFSVLELDRKARKERTVLRKAGVRLTPAEAAARKQVQALAGEGVDLVVMLALTGLDRAKELAAAIKGIHLVVVARSGKQLETPVRVDKTFIVEPGRRGMRLGVVELRLGAGWSREEVLVDDSQRHVMHAEAKSDQKWLHSRYGSSPSRAKHDPRFIRLQRLAKQLEGVRAPAGARHTLIARLVELDRSIPDHHAVRGLVQASRGSWAGARRRQLRMLRGVHKHHPRRIRAKKLRKK
jgi:2',3'-cyclic-nucleotide 2'-phosphodiesterase (5'-nucleotidase family)